MKTKILGIVFVSLLLAVPFAFADVLAIPVQKQIREYSWMEQTMDRVGLWFAWKDEQKLEVMNKIQERRQAHYEFLIAKGKTEQAQRFQQRTQEMTQLFEQQRTRIQERLMDGTGTGVQQRVQTTNQNAGSRDMIQEKERIRDPTTHTANQTIPIRQGANN